MKRLQAHLFQRPATCWPHACCAQMLHHSSIPLLGCTLSSAPQPSAAHDMPIPASEAHLPFHQRFALGLAQHTPNRKYIMSAFNKPGMYTASTMSAFLQSNGSVSSCRVPPPTQYSSKECLSFLLFFRCCKPSRSKPFQSVCTLGSQGIPGTHVTHARHCWPLRPGTRSPPPRVTVVTPYPNLTPTNVHYNTSAKHTVPMQSPISSPHTCQRGR